MSGFFGFVSVVAFLGAILGVATLIKPFWFVRSRKQGGGLALSGFVVWVVAAIASAATVPPKPMPARPASITEADWQARRALCEEAGFAVSSCIAQDEAVERARARIAQRKQAAANAAAEAERQAEEARAAELAAREFAWIERTKDAVRSRLRNPSSAEFRNVALYRPFKGRDTPVVCGEVNSENGFGGMSGFQGFIGSGTTVGPFLEEQMGPGEFARSQAEMCVNATAVPVSTN